MDTDVLIVGAGPTGLMLANQFGRFGVRAMIIDRHNGPAEQSRAMAVHARTLEIYSKLGIARQALALGKRGLGANMWAQGRPMARIPIGDIGAGLSPFPFVLMLGQDDNERILGDKLADWGMSVQWNTELVALEQHADHVVATLRQTDGTLRTVSTAWLAGCDGARSAVRDMCGISFPGEPYEHVFFVADTIATGKMVPNEVNVYLWKDGFHLFFPMADKDGWRVIGILPAHLRGRDDLTFEEVIPSVRREAGINLSFHGCHWFSTYRIHHRAAEKFRAGRCFLLGDAAHIHSPMGGQGMNTGLQDAYNLAWKLALVVHGDADSALLDSYEAERQPVAHRLLHTTDRAFRLVVADTWLAGMLRTHIMARVAAFAMRRERVRRFAFQTLSQIGIRYPKSALSHTLSGLPDGAPVAGDRFPWLRLKFEMNGPVEDMFEKLDDTRFHLIAFGQDAPSPGALGMSQMLRTHTIPADLVNDRELARVSIPGESFYLLRPDGHVGMAGTRLDAEAVRRYFTSAVRYRDGSGETTELTMRTVRGLDSACSASPTRAALP